MFLFECNCLFTEIRPQLVGNTHTHTHTHTSTHTYVHIDTLQCSLAICHLTSNMSSVDGTLLNTKSMVSPGLTSVSGGLARVMISNIYQRQEWVGELEGEGVVG